MDIMVILDEQPTSRDSCNKMCQGYDNLLQLEGIDANHNLCTVNDGMVNWVYKGTADEVNNSMLDTFELHTQLEDNVITKRMDRDIHLKAVRGLRIILSFFSRGECRKEVKAALKGGINDKIECLEMLIPRILTSYHLNKGVLTEIEAYKTIAFQIGQIYGLYTYLELYTKQDIARVFPALAPYLRREDVGANRLVKSLSGLLRTFKDCIVLQDFQYRYGSDSNENHYDEFRSYLDNNPIGCQTLDPPKTEKEKFFESLEVDRANGLVDV